MSNNTEHYLADHERLQDKLEKNWLSEKRLSALSGFEQNGFPNTRQENWKYTDVRAIARGDFTATSDAEVSISHEEIANIRFNDLDCYELTFVNGKFRHDLSQLEGLPEGVIVCDLAEAIEKYENLVSANMTNEAESNVSSFTALNTAFVQHGAFIYLPKKVVLEKPINLLYLAKDQETNFAAHPRNVIVMESQSSAVVIESYIGLDDSQYFTNAVSDLSLAAAARLDHYKVQQESMNSYHIGYLKAQQHKDSYLESHSISLGGAIVRNDIHSQLDAAGAEIVMNGLYMTSGKQHVDNHTRVDHLKPHTLSTENYRGVLNDRSRAVFNGKVIVHKDAQKIEAHQNNANLLLSDDAEIDTKPELEIYADDVKCSHGATVGQLDKDMLFYLRSRAIDEDTARSLLTFAFAEEVISKIKLAPIRHRLEYLVVGQLPDADLIREFTNE